MRTAMPALGRLAVFDFFGGAAQEQGLGRHLRQRGFKIVGSTICYAHMQANGKVKDRAADCFRRVDVLGAR